MQEQKIKDILDIDYINKNIPRQKRIPEENFSLHLVDREFEKCIQVDKSLCNYKNITQLCITDHPTAQPTAVVPVYRYHLSHLPLCSTTVVVGNLIKQLPTEQCVPTDDYDSDSDECSDVE